MKTLTVAVLVCALLVGAYVLWQVDGFVLLVSGVVVWALALLPGWIDRLYRRFGIRE